MSAGSGAELAGYREYLLQTGSDPKADERQKVVRFRSRFRLARDFEGLRLHGSHDRRTVRGYEALLRVTLAFSALDQLHSVTGTGVGTIRDRAIADELRSTLDLNSISENEKTSRMRGVGAFDDLHSTDDVAVFARALRHMFAHGSGTPWGVDATNTAAVAALGRLSERLLTEGERRFDEWFRNSDAVASQASDLEETI